jgi:hypothetical protein
MPTQNSLSLHTDRRLRPALWQPGRTCRRQRPYRIQPGGAGARGRRAPSRADRTSDSCGGKGDYSMSAATETYKATPALEELKSLGRRWVY